MSLFVVKETIIILFLSFLLVVNNNAPTKMPYITIYIYREYII